MGHTDFVKSSARYVKDNALMVLIELGLELPRKEMSELL
jgi:hypothetical protein